MGMIQAHTEELIDSDAKPVRVIFAYKSPANIDRYKEIFRCPLRFSREFTQMTFPAGWLACKIDTCDPQTEDVLGTLIASLHEKRSTGGDIVNDVKMAMRRIPGEFPRVQQIADSLAMSPRILRRKLGQHDVHHQELLDEERRGVAEDYLRNTGKTVQQIADLCGFTDAQNFSQAFRRWTGMSPTEFRAARPQR